MHETFAKTEAAELLGNFVTFTKQIFDIEFGSIARIEGIHFDDDGIVKLVLADPENELYALDKKSFLASCEIIDSGFPVVY